MITATETYTPEMALNINKEMFGVPNIDAWFKVLNNPPHDLAQGLISDAQAYMEVGMIREANQRLNRAKWIIANKL